MTSYKQHLMHGSCECGNCSLELKITPEARFICHCTICQAFTGKPYADMTLIRAKHVRLINADQILFKKYRLPPNIDRGICLNCKNPVIEFGGFGALKWAFIPVSNFESQELLPLPQMHIFYDKRLIDLSDKVPKHNGYIHSQIAIGKMLLAN